MRIMHRAVIFSLLAILGAGSLAAAPLTDRQVQDLGLRGDLPRMQLLAERGDARAQRWMGWLLRRRGRHEEAVRWYARAVEQGDGQSAREIADLYATGIGVRRDPREAIDWYRKGAVLGDARSQERYASALRSGELVPRNESQAYRLYVAAVRQHYDYAYLPLAEMSATGIGAPRDWQRAYALAMAAELAVDDSDTQSQSRARSLRAEAAARLDPRERRSAEQLFAALRPDLAERRARRSARGLELVGLIGMFAAAVVFILWWRGGGRVRL